MYRPLINLPFFSLSALFSYTSSSFFSSSSSYSSFQCTNLPSPFNHFFGKIGNKRFRIFSRKRKPFPSVLVIVRERHVVLVVIFDVVVLSSSSSSSSSSPQLLSKSSTYYRGKPNEGAGGSYVKKMKSRVMEQWVVTCAQGSVHVLLPVTRRLIDSQTTPFSSLVFNVFHRV